MNKFVILRIANEVITSGQVFNLDTGAGGVGNLALRRLSGAYRKLQNHKAVLQEQEENLE